ncbi:MAG: ATP-dependent helicase HrpB [Paracoccaceae bacterium]|jgi:ATP-dependent helicase HrpB
MSGLPITAVLDDVLAALRDSGQVVLQAPPGAGKTTMVPLAMLRAFAGDGVIMMLEPRRLAARSAAERMATLLGEPVGEQVGYRIKGAAKVSARTRIEVVTEGILTRRLQNDPELRGVSAVIFDEFHERSLNGDLGLALCLEVRAALREDLLLVVMSATLDAEPVAALMGGAPVITSQGRSFPVDLQYLDHPRARTARLEADVAALTVEALTQTSGSVLVFLPGEGEIRRVERALSSLIDPAIAVHPLFGAMPFAQQQAAIAPAGAGRKVVLATSIAETSLTIEGITAVVDAGLARRARFDPGSGMSKLVTERVTQAEAKQRAGRAGRLAPGVCFKLWTKGEDGALAAFPPAEIEAADLTGLALELALWGGDSLPFLTMPPAGALREARELLQGLGALDAKNRLTPHGRSIARLPLHPRLGHMLLRAGKDAAPLAAMLTERDPLRGAGCDLHPRMEVIVHGPARPENRAAIDQIRRESKRLARLAPPCPAMPFAEAAALAFPDRIGLKRPGDPPRWLLSGGKGAVMDATDTLAQTRLLVVLDADGDPTEARIRLAAPLSDSALRRLFEDRITWHKNALWSRRERKVLARDQEMFGALVLRDQVWHDAPDTALARAALDGVRQLGLPWSDAARRLQARALLFHETGGDIADLSDTALIDTAQTWLLPYLDGVRTAENIRALDLLEPLRTHIGWAALQALDAQVPSHFTTPMDRKIAIDYAGDHPEVSLRIQEMFGVTVHPTVGPARRPLRVTLLSPAGRPLQTTMDLPGFWASSYADVRKDMRGRYPRHPWPEDPTRADPTLRVKKRS